MTPYIPGAWKQALADAYLTSAFPNLVHDITYGSLIGNPPPLLHTFIPKNLASATLLPDIIENELLNETSSGRMSRPFSVEEAHVIFNGHFRTSPVGLVEKVPGDGNWRIIRHLSKTDHLGFSPNDALDSHDFPTLFFSAAHVAELVRVCPITVLICPFSCSMAASEIVCSLIGLLLSHRPLAHTLPACLLVGRLLAYCFTLLGIGALCFLCRLFPVPPDCIS